MANLNFSLSYRTKWGELLQIHYELPDGRKGCCKMHTQDGESWSVRIETETHYGRMTYYYSVCDECGNELRIEKGAPRNLQFFDKHTLYIYDHWADEGLPAVLLRSAFSECVFRPERIERPLFTHALLMLAPPPPRGYRWGVTGSSTSWGAWDVRYSPRFFRVGVYEWLLPFTAEECPNGTEYKYILLNEHAPDDVKWEGGNNRVLKFPCEVREDSVCISYDCNPDLETLPWRGAGVVIPVFSLRSRDGFGVGDFGDLFRLVELTASVGMKAIQILPINDTSATFSHRDSYPYSGISVFALHPLYIDPREWKGTTAFRRSRGKGRRLNALPTLDYEAAIRLKMNFLRDLFAELGGEVLKSPEFHHFCQDNRRWLKPYVLFCHLRDHFDTADFRQWGEYANYNAHRLERLLHDNGEVRKETTFYAFVQYLLHRQLTRVREKAREKGVILKGDLPIGIGRRSVPAWVDASLFHFEGQAGAPPDAFATHGQNWGFPTYNWEAMAADGYAWWRHRLKHMARYFDAFRIDHVLGFFRIWEIPEDQIYGVLGHFRPALPLGVDGIRAAGFHSDVRQFSIPSWPIEDKECLCRKVGVADLSIYFRTENGRFFLLPELGTQRQIADVVKQKQQREALLDFACEVLFIEDPERPGTYHPRISAHETKAYKSLSISDRQAFDGLYDDFYYHRHNVFWKEQAMRKLPAVTECTDMLPCAEDLGMVPDSVKGTLEQLQVLSLEVQRMPKRVGVYFDDLSQNPYLSVATIATHDMPPFRLWWETGGQAERYWREVLHHEGMPPHEAEPWLCEEVIVQHLSCPSMLCLLSLQDWLGMDAHLRRHDPSEEQINHPENAEQYWNYRVHLCLEDLVKASDFNERVRSLIARSGR